MNNCNYCKKFNKVWTILKKQYNSKIIMKKINGPDNPQYMKQYKLSTFPTLILEDTHRSEVYSGNRTLKDLKKFIN